MIHLDTNFLIHALVPNSSEASRLEGWLRGGEDLAVSVIVWSEFLCGPVTADVEIIARQLFPVAEALLKEDAEKAAQFFNLTGRRSRSLADCMIAAIAVRCGAKLATANRNDFQPLRSQGLHLA